MKNVSIAVLILAASIGLGRTGTAQQAGTPHHMDRMTMQCPMTGQMAPADVKYENTSDGARLVFTPKDASQLSLLREWVRQYAEHLAKGDCSVMPNMMREMGRPQSAEPKSK